MKDARRCIRDISSGDSSYGDTGEINSHRKLTVAYQALWKTYSDEVKHCYLQTRLFQLVLTAFYPLTLEQITQALRIDPLGREDYQEGLSSEHVGWLCHNFLRAPLTGAVGWAHKYAEV